MNYYIYIITNKNRTTLYIWVTNNLVKRIDQHKLWTLDSFSRNYKLEMLIYYEMYGDIKEAIIREKQLKKRSRIKKIELIKQHNPNLDELVFDKL